MKGGFGKMIKSISLHSVHCACMHGSMVYCTLDEFTMHCV